MLTVAKIHKAGRIDQLVRDYFDINKSITEIAVKELMPLFIQNGIFKSNHRDGLPIRNFLRELDADNKLNLLKHIKVDRKVINRNWYFIR